MWRTSSGRARRDISALFRTKAYQSQSQFITNLDFQTVFLGEIGESEGRHKLQFNCYPPHRVQSNAVAELAHKRESLSVVALYFGTTGIALFLFFVVVLGAPLSGPAATSQTARRHVSTGG